MDIETFISRRYLVSKHKINFITIISLISIFGITIGVAALIIVLSVFNGFSSLVTSFLLNLDPHLRVEFVSADADANKVKQIFREMPEIRDASAFVSGKILAYRDGLYDVANLKGIEESKNSVYQLKDKVKFGKYELTTPGGVPGIILGLRLADKLQTITEDTITIISPAGLESAITQFSLPNSRQFIVKGIFSSNNNEYDESFMFSSIEDAQFLFGYKDNFQGYDIMLDDINDAFNVKEELSMKLDQEDYSINTWFDFHKDLYSVMQIERWSAYIILSLIIAVATFNLLGSLSMSVIEKKRDIGILQALGLQEKSILKIFMFEGLLIGIAGTAAGCLLGYFVCFLQIQYNIYPLDPAQYKINSLPLELRLSDFFFIAGISMLLSFLASWYPAKRAAKINPVEAIKWE